MSVEATWVIEGIVHTSTGAHVVATCTGNDTTMLFGISKQTANGRAFLDAVTKGSLFKSTLELESK